LRLLRSGTLPRAIVATVLLTAAVLKLGSPGVAPDWAWLGDGAFAYLIASVEVVLGVALLVSARPLPSIAAAFLLIAFTFYLAMSEGVGMEESCGCFGGVGFSFWKHIALNAGLLMLLGLGIPQDHRRSSSNRSIR